jgi:lipocalin
LGQWYEIERFPFIQEDNLRCVGAEYTFIDATTVKVNNTGINM